ncbi:MAG TPA: regulatory protein GemA [Nevskiaceae bacterium]|nr:regulatory protein GemA [Nevskiaceae bacterium]
MKKPLRNRELGRIHILKEALGLDRATYEAMLWTIGRKESAAELDDYGRRQVIAHQEALLRQVDPKHRALSYPARPRNLDVGDRKELRKIEALLADAGVDWSYAHGLARRMYRRDRVQLCHAGQLAGIIAALEKQALKRLAEQLQQIFGEAWAGQVERIAAQLFGFDWQHRDITRYTEPLSRVLRWWHGELQPACEWPPAEGAYCQGCYERRQARAA